MKIRTYDRLGSALIAAVFAFSGWVAVTGWEWFPVKDDWSEIAHIPPNLPNYLALLSPWLVLLAYLIIRRVLLKRPF